MHRDEVNSSPSHSLAIVSSLYVLQLFYSELLMPVRSSRDAGGILANFRRKMKTRFTNGDKFGSLAHIFFFFSFLFFFLFIHSFVQQWFLAKRSRVSKCYNTICANISANQSIAAAWTLWFHDLQLSECLFMSARLGNKLILISSMGLRGLFPVHSSSLQLIYPINSFCSLFRWFLNNYFVIIMSIQSP